MNDSHITRILKNNYFPALNTCRTYFYSGIFVSLFMIIFQPFGLSVFTSEYKVPILLGYGMIVFVSSCLLLLGLRRIFPDWFKEQDWTVAKQILLTGSVIVSISFSIYFYSIMSGIFEGFSMEGFMLFLWYSMVISVFPIIGTALTTYILVLKNEKKGVVDVSEAKRMGDFHEQMLHLYSSKRNKVLSIPQSSLAYVESIRNYVSIAYYQEKKLVHTSLRNTLSNIADQLTDVDSVKQVHRAFLVNLLYVEQVSGNSKGLRLSLKDSHVIIPVSRNYVSAFKEYLKSFAR